MTTIHVDPPSLTPIASTPTLWSHRAAFVKLTPSVRTHFGWEPAPHEQAKRVERLFVEFARAFKFCTQDFAFITGIVFTVTDHLAHLLVKCRLANRDASGEPVFVDFHSARPHAAFQSLRDVSVWVRESIRDALIHEMDECLYVDDTRPFDPHAFVERPEP